MKTQKENNRTVHYFHIGRGGRFYNGGHKTYVGIIKTNEIESKIDLNLSERMNGKFHYSYFDNAGNEIISRRDFVNGLKNGRLVVDFDTIYDTDIFCTIEKMTDDEKELYENSL